MANEWDQFALADAGGDQSASGPGRMSFEDATRRWMAKGYPRAAAEGIAQNMIRESGGDPDAIGDEGTSGGLFQHHADRLAALKAYAAEKGKAWTDPGIQIDFAETELRDKFPELRKELLTAKDRGAAEDQFKRIFERPASVMWANRPNGQPVLAAGNYRYADGLMDQAAAEPGRSLVLMQPDDYLAMSPALDDQAGQSAKARSLRASIDAGEPIDALPSLDLGPSGRSLAVKDQDGRHRALFAQQAGVDAIPVSVSGLPEQAPGEVIGAQGKPVPWRAEPAQAPARGKGGLLSWLIPSAEAAEPTRQATPGSPQQVSGGDQGGEDDFSQFQPAGSPGGGDDFSQFSAAPTGDQRGLAERFGTGLMDVALGTTQLVSRPVGWLGEIVPGNVGRFMRAIPQAIDETAADREKQIQAERGGETGIDWGRFAGNVAGTLPMGLLRAGPMALRAALQGGAAALTQPVTSGSFGTEKAIQAAEGAAGGVAGQAAGELIGRGLSYLSPLVRYVRGIGGQNATDKAAVREVLRRIEQSDKSGGPTAQEMLDLHNATPDKPLTLADVGGENMLALAGRLARTPGESRQIITQATNERQLGAMGRLVSDVDSGLAGGSAYDAATALAQSRATAAKPLWEKAFAEPVTLDKVRNVQQFITDPIGQRALQRGLRIAQLESMGEGGMGIHPEQLGATRSPQTGHWIIDPRVASGEKAPSMMLLHAVKKGYDTIVEGMRDKTTGRLNITDPLVRATNDARAEYVKRLRATFPAYRDALDAWSGPSQSMDALRRGQKFLTQRPEEIARQVGDLKGNDLEFFKMGAADTLRTRLMKGGPASDEARKVIQHQYMRDQLRPMFKSDAELDKFVKSVEAEGRMHHTFREVLKGSPTAQRLAEDTSPEAEAFTTAGHAAVQGAHGNYLGAVTNGLRAMAALARSPDPQLNAAVARLLTSPLNQPGSAGLDILRNYSALLPQTRNYVLEGARRAAALGAPAAGLLAGGGPQ